MPLSSTTSRHCSPAAESRAARPSRSPTKRARTRTTGGSSSRRNFKALPIRFCRSWRICKGSAMMLGIRPSSTRPCTCWICTSRSETTSAATAARSTGTKSCPLVVTRESDSRPWIRFCIRSAAVCIRSRHSRPAGSRAAAQLIARRSPKVRIFRSGSWRSCEATYANCSSSWLDRSSSAAYRGLLFFRPLVLADVAG